MTIMTFGFFYMTTTSFTYHICKFQGVIIINNVTIKRIVSTRVLTLGVNYLMTANDLSIRFDTLIALNSPNTGAKIDIPKLTH